LLTAGAPLLQHSGLSALDFFGTVDDNYGIDPDGQVSIDNAESDGITIPQTTLKFSETDYSLLQQTIDPYGQTDNYGIDLYEQNVQLISTFIPL